MLWSRALEAASLVCRTLNMWRLPTPSMLFATADKMQLKDIDAYKINYARWIECCYTPCTASVLAK